MTPKLRLRLLLVILAATLSGGGLLWLLPDPPSEVHVGRFSFLSLGDSYTVGEGVPAVDSWPRQLARALRAEGLDLSDPVILARTGWTSGDLASGLAKVRLSRDYDLVSLLIGANDIYRGVPEEEFRRNLSQLLQEAVALARGRPAGVVLVSIPDWGATPQAAQRGREAPAVARQVDQCNAIVRELAAAAGARFVDITPASRRLAAAPGSLVRDGLHPSAPQYAEWVRDLAPACRAALPK